MLKYPFEDPFQDILRNPDRYIDAVFACLESDFLVMPKGTGFVDYRIFEEGYEALKIATKGFADLEVSKVLQVALEKPISILVLRTMLGYSPPEWAYLAAQGTGVDVTQGYIRSLDRKVRMSPEIPLKANDLSKIRLKAMVETACRMLTEGAPQVKNNELHRLNKADTKRGLESIQTIAGMGVPYSMLLYERFLGRPFAGHRDSVSELIGGRLESAIEDVMTKAGISYRKTKRAERVEGFDQAPDFIIPSEFNPKIVIEAKITEDDGTARDKVTRIQHLGQLSLDGRSADDPKFEVIACIGGRGFAVRREDMKKMILATRGKVFTLNTLNQLVRNTGLKDYCSK